MSGACFPTTDQEQLLRACFLPPEVSEFPAAPPAPALSDDPAATVLLPLLDWRWGDRLPPDLMAQAKSLRLTYWRQGRERLDLAASLAATLRDAGIHAVFLKGVALIARYYPDPGLRGVGDIDFLVPRDQVRPAAEALAQAGWLSEDALSAPQIQAQMRARHAWQFYKPPASADTLEDETMCDLHWHPVVRCYSPRVADLFLEGAEPVQAGGGTLRIPCAADLLFHVAVHGLQWSWTSPLRWIPDAQFLLRSGNLDWDRVRALAEASDMTHRVHRALEYLKDHFGAPVPAIVLDSLASAPRWQAQEQVLLEKPSPLSLPNAIRWHLYNFKRLRRSDPSWQGSNSVTGFFSYLSLFFRAPWSRL